ncbi:MAG: Gldg family protein [Verrucomicrobiota bacterium]
MSAPTFRFARRFRTVNLLAQAVLVLSLLGGLNYLAIHHGWRHDLTENRRHSLSPETQSYLRDLRAPVKIIVTLTDTGDDEQVNQAHRDVSALLREYTEATVGNGARRVTVDYLDVYRQRREAEAYSITQPNVILVTSGGKSRVIGLHELYEMEGREKKGFKGEQAFTAAILDVTSPEKKKLYFLSGHGEMQLTDVDPARGLSALHDELLIRNFALDELDLAKAARVPADAALVIIAAPPGPPRPPRGGVAPPIPDQQRRPRDRAAVPGPCARARQPVLRLGRARRRHLHLRPEPPRAKRQRRPHPLARPRRPTGHQVPRREPHRAALRRHPLHAGRPGPPPRSQSQRDSPGRHLRRGLGRTRLPPAPGRL